MTTPAPDPGPDQPRREDCPKSRNVDGHLPDPDQPVPSAQAAPRSPSKEMIDFGAQLTGRITEGIAEQQARAEAGLPPLPISAEAIEYAGRVARRAFWTLYNEGEDYDSE